MTPVDTRAREIVNREGFDVIVMRGRQAVNVRDNGLMGAFGFGRILKNTATVADWKRGRFERTYPGLSCDVLMGDGTTAPGQATLRTVRASYQT